MSSPLAKRVYGGQSAEARAAQRKEQLLDAALEVIGSGGYRAAKINDICRLAGVSQRYFYEAFRDSETLLIELYHRQLSRMISQISKRLEIKTDEPLRSLQNALQSFFHTVDADPHSARIIFFELHGVSNRTREVFLAGRKRARLVLLAFMKSLFDDLPEDDIDLELLSIALIGALLELTRSWLANEIEATIEQLVAKQMAIIALVNRFSD